MSDRREETTRREGIIDDAIGGIIKSAIEGHLPSAALERCAEEDVDAVVQVVVGEINAADLTVVSRNRIADYLLTHAQDGDASDWQAGHNYAMQEAARLVREAWDLLNTDGAS